MWEIPTGPASAGPAGPPNVPAPLTGLDLDLTHAGLVSLRHAHLEDSVPDLSLHLVAAHRTAECERPLEHPVHALGPMITAVRTGLLGLPFAANRHRVAREAHLDVLGCDARKVEPNHELLRRLVDVHRRREDCVQVAAGGAARQQAVEQPVHLVLNAG